MEHTIYFWNDDDVILSGNTQIRLGHPELREKLYTFDAEWEGNTVSYFNIVQYNGTYYMYYGANSYPPYVCDHLQHIIAICLLTSKDGLHFEPAKINTWDFFGNKENNIVFMGDINTDNFTVMVDTNPACPENERFKAMVGGIERLPDGRGIGILDCYVSSDGLHFTYKKRMPVAGNFDSQNTLIYDKNRQTYILYSRKMSGSPESPNWGGIRTIRVCYSKDLESFSEPKMIEYSNEYPFEMYTNGIRQYGDIFIGTPTRYTERVKDNESLMQLPDRTNREKIISQFGRSGTAMTDTLFMFSKDGEHFYRFPEAFLTPGIESARNWYYGDCYLSHGHIITESMLEGAPKEISFYASRNYRSDKACELWRYTLRQDGFAFIEASYDGGSIKTKDEFKPKQIELNFASSCAGYIQIKLLNGDMVCYTSPRIFGDSIKRIIDIPNLGNNSFTIELELSDAKVYSMTILESVE